MRISTSDTIVSTSHHPAGTPLSRVDLLFIAEYYRRETAARILEERRLRRLEQMRWQEDGGKNAE